ncbi:MAG: fumarylacetoacetate hydrolase family protein [Pseudomonadota bacterium]
MRLVTYTDNSSTRIGALKADGIVDLRAFDSSIPTNMVELLRGGEEMLAKAMAAVEQGEASVKLSHAKLESPIQNPPKILAIGLNYLDHFYEIPEEVRQEKGIEVPKVPVVFNKQPLSANGPYDPVMLPSESKTLDYEAELAVVIGKTCRRVKPEDAFSVIAGYTILNDVTVREWQIASPTMTMGKSWDTHCPMGPALVTVDEIPDPENLKVKTMVDGEERQNFNTGDMIFKIADQIAHLSTAFTLQPGDVIATGTSAGVALFRPGHPWLEEGQTVRVEIEGLGHIENRVEADPGISFIR